MNNNEINFKELGLEIRNSVNREKLCLVEVFKKVVQDLKLNKPDTLFLALAASPEGRLDQAIIIIYNAFQMTPKQLQDEIAEFMRGGRWDRLSYATLNIVEDLLGLRRDSLYSIFRSD